jgi:hypothetical protein
MSLIQFKMANITAKNISSKLFTVLFFKCEMLLLLLILSDQEGPSFSPIL